MAQKYEGVRSTADAAPIQEKDDYFVYVRTNVQRIDEQDTETEAGFHGWQYDETVYTKDEYINYLESQVIDTQIALTEVYELIGG